MHFLRLLAARWTCAQSVRDNHVFACNFTKILIFTDFNNAFTDRLTDKPFLNLIWLLTTPPHLKYVAVLPCDLSLIACFLTLTIHKVVWQHMQGVVGFLINYFTANLPRNLPVNFF